MSSSSAREPAVGWPRTSSLAPASTSPSSKPAVRGTTPPTPPCSPGRTIRRDAAHRRGSGRLGSSTAASADGRFPESPTPLPPERDFAGGGRAWSAAERTTGAASRSALDRAISRRRRSTAWGMTGRSATTTCAPITRSSSSWSGASGAMKTSRTRRASGVTYVDTTDGSEHHIDARVVVVAASACETSRLLLNSKSASFPNGLANGSGTVGKYLTDTTGTDVSGFIPKMMDHVPHNHDGVGGMHLYMPWWLDNKTLDFPRGYHIEVWGGAHLPEYGFMGGIHRYPSGGGYGKQLKDDYRRYYGAAVGFSGRGEMIPNDDTYCELDPRTVDRWGIPVLRFHWKWTDHEYKQVKHMQETFRALVAELGGEVFAPMPTAERGK